MSILYKHLIINNPLDDKLEYDYRGRDIPLDNHYKLKKDRYD